MPTNYSLMDATLEISLMLLAAFLLGWLFCWVLKKIFGKRGTGTTDIEFEKAIESFTQHADEPTEEHSRLLTSSHERFYHSEDNLNKEATDTSSPLTTAVIERDHNAVEAATELRPRINIPDLSPAEADIHNKLSRDIRSEVDTVTINQSNITAAVKEKVIDEVSNSSDLQDIMSNDTLETSFNVDRGELSEALNTTPSLNSMTDVKDKVMDSTPEASLSEKEVENMPITDAELEQNERSSTPITTLDLPQANEQVKPSTNKYNLTLITGLDQQMADILVSKGITSFKDLQGTDSRVLQYHLTSLGRRIETANWPQQAKLCAEQNWSKLAEYQAFLVEKSTTHDKDDLKKIEGIGPFFESLLNKANITTYSQLKNSDRDSLKAIIDAAGPEYRLHEPETWPYQAGLADRGEWKKLQDYIYFMTGRS